MNISTMVKNLFNETIQISKLIANFQPGLFLIIFSSTFIKKKTKILLIYSLKMK